MGKASSSKKVARAAGTGGGRSNRSSTPWTFVGIIALIVVVGVALTFTSRARAHNLKNAATNTNATVAPTVGGTPWNEALGVYVCGSFLPAIRVTSDTTGITTAGGVIHIAPTVKRAAGKNATLGVFASSIGMTLSGSELQVPGGKRYTNGDHCAGGVQGKVYIKQYPYAGSPIGTVETSDPAAVPLVDNALLTIAFVPSADRTRIPPPPASAQANLQKATAPTTTVPTTTVPTTTAPTTTAPTTTVPTTTVPGPATGTTVRPSSSSATTTPGSATATTK